MTDYLSCGHPDLSYHGKRAWLGDFENYSRSVGAFYGGDYIEANSGGKETDSFFYVAYNMHWIPTNSPCRIFRKRELEDCHRYRP